MSDRLIFLDFDGVLNALRSDVGGPIVMAEGPDLDPRMVARVNRIVHVAGASVVLSTSWRCMGHPKPDDARWWRRVPRPEQVAWLTRCLGIAGFVGDVIGATPALDRGPSGERPCRGDEIKQWLVDHASPRQSLAILDDSADMGSMAPWLVHTNGDVGLTDDDADRAIQILGGKR